jgi:hypothetical protein
MERITASAFEVTCLPLIDDVAATGEPRIITKPTQSPCQLFPYRLKPKTHYGALHGSMMITGDLIAPLDVAWETLQ